MAVARARSYVCWKRQNRDVADSLLDQIEKDALNDAVPVATALRKCVALGGRSGSEALRDWAAKELNGYQGEDGLPGYRVIGAPLRLDGMSGNYKITGEALPPMALPDFVRGVITEEVELRQGVGEIEALLEYPEIKLQPAGAADLAMYMNSQSGDRFRHVQAIYWHVSKPSVRGVLDQVRTTLTQLVAELRATTPTTQPVPTAEAATQAVNVVLKGMGRKTVTVTAAQSSAPDSKAANKVVGPPEPESGFWTTSRRIGAAIVGLAGIAAAVFAGIEVF